MDTMALLVNDPRRGDEDCACSYDLTMVPKQVMGGIQWT